MCFVPFVVKSKLTHNPPPQVLPRLRFLSASPRMASETPPQSVPDERTQFAVLLFTDICDSTALKSQHGAIEYKRAAELHNRLFESLAAEEKLTLIKNTGDGYFARSTSVAAVVRFALRFQHGMRTMAWPGFPITTRVGIHAGEVADITTLGQADVLAPAADLVARVMGLAVGGQILLTRGPFDEARHFVRAHPQVENGEVPTLTWLAHGPYLFKGCEEPVEVFEVGASEGAPLVAPPDGEKAKRVLRPGEEETLGWRPAGGLEVPGRAEWVLVRKLGEGGFGEVWLARHRTLKDQRVFKFCFDADKARSLKREVTLFRVLRDRIGSSAGIVAVHDVSFDEPPYFIVMDFIDGPDLAGWAAAHVPLDSVPLETRLEIIAQVADALQSAHDAGVIHRDVKPSNILIEENGEKDGQPRARLADFGIGQLVSGDTPSGITQIGFTQTMVNEDSLTGTRLYLAPEMLAGQPATIRSDIYALGVMLYQLTVGAMNRPLTSDWGEDIADPLLREDIQHCVAGDPAKRFAGGAQLAAHLRTLPQRRMEKEAAERLRARAARRKKQVRLLSFAAAAVVIVAVFLTFAFARERGLKLKIAEEGRRAESEAVRAEAGEAKATKALADLKKTAPTMLALAESEAGFQRFDSALGKIDTALLLDPGLLPAYWRRAWILIGQEQWSAAADAIRLAQQRDPAHAALADILPTVEEFGAAPEQERWVPKWMERLIEHLQKVGASGEFAALSRKLQLGAEQKRKLVEDRITEWLGKLQNNGTHLTVTATGLINVWLNNAATLEPLRGLPIDELKASQSSFTSLEPLRGMRLCKLEIYGAYKVTDLSPLHGMPLREFIIDNTKLTDLSPLRGMPLEKLTCAYSSQLVDFSPLNVAALREVIIDGDSVSDLTFLAKAPLEFLKAYNNRISDLSPLRGKRLRLLRISMNKITDLSPLHDTQIDELDICDNPIADYTPLLQVPKLEKLRVSSAGKKLEPLRQHPNLKFIAYNLAPYRPVAEFWAEYDAQQAVGKK